MILSCFNFDNFLFLVCWSIAHWSLTVGNILIFIEAGAFIHRYINILISWTPGIVMYTNKRYSCWVISCIVVTYGYRATDRNLVFSPINVISPFVCNHNIRIIWELPSDLCSLKWFSFVLIKLKLIFTLSNLCLTNNKYFQVCTFTCMLQKNVNTRQSLQGA